MFHTQYINLATEYLASDE